jgi:hypothetical protein
VLIRGNWKLLEKVNEVVMGIQTFCSACSRRETDEPTVICISCAMWFHAKCAQQSEAADINNWECQFCVKKDVSHVVETSVGAVPKGNDKVLNDLASALERSMSREKDLLAENVEIENEAIAKEKIWIAEKIALENKIKDLEKRFEKVNVNENVDRLMNSLNELKETGQVESINLETRRAENDEIRRLRLLEEEDRLSVASSHRVSARARNLAGFRRNNDEVIEDGMSVASSHRVSSRVQNPVGFRQNNDQMIGCRSSAVSVNSNQSVSAVEKYLIRQHLENLPDFTGDVEKWPEFVKVYEETTREGLFSDHENLTRLKKHIKSPAKDLVGGMQGNTTAKRIMEALHNLYGRSEILMGKYTKELMNFPSITSTTDSNIKKFAMKLNDYCGIISDMKLESNLKNAMFESVLIQKLERAPALYSRWMKMSKGRSMNIKDFAGFITKVWTEMPPEHRDGKVKNESRTKSVMSHQVETVKDSSKAKCIFCGENDHRITKCKKFTAKTTQERKQFVKDKRLCFSCLFSGHSYSDCKYKRTCNTDGCKSEHNKLLHEQSSSATSVKPEPSAPSAEAVSEDTSGTQVGFHSNGNILTKIVPVRLYGNGNFVDTYAFFDDGAQVTMVEEDVVKPLNLKGSNETLTLRWTKNITRTEKCIRSSVKISGVQGSKKKYDFENVYIVESLNLPKRSQDGEELCKKFKHLKGLKLPSFHDVTPRMIIGADQAKFIIGFKTRAGNDNEPIALKTRFGWAIMGANVQEDSILSMSTFHSPSVTLSYHEATVGDKDLHELVKRHFTTENFGISPSSRILKSRDDERAEQIMNDTLKFVDGRYEIGLLWKEENQIPEDFSYDMAKKRLINLEASLKNNESTRSWMNNHVNQLVEKGYARLATEEDLKTKWKRVWYCPMFVVVNKNKDPPKPRCVMDTAAKANKMSLNSNLLPGPDNLASLMGGLTRFREQSIAVNGDVKEMFHQVRINLSDQQCQRFLWRSCDDTIEPKIYIMQAMMFGPTCSPSQAQFVKNQHAEKYREKCPEAVDGLQKYTYVDDYFNSHATIEEAVRVTNDAIKICADMKFDLVNFQSNSSELLNSIPKRNVKEQMVDLENENVSSLLTKILGMHWDAKNDVFVFKRKNDDLMKRMMTVNYRPTKRETLQVVMRMFDPLGFISKYLIRGKMVLQDVWRSGIDWDVKIPEELAVDWRKFIESLDLIEKVKIPRNYAPVDPNQCQVSLIVFADASDKAFSAECFFRLDSGSEVYVALAAAKAKVAPVNPLTIPRLELQAALLGVRVASMVKSITSFKIHETRFLSDSTCVLSWICDLKTKQQMFVGSRIGEILEKSSSNEWYYVPSKLNVADEATKVTKEEDDVENSRWFKGPDFLKLPFDQWPVEQATNKVCKIHESKSECIASMTHSKVEDDIIDRMKWDFKYDWKKCVHVVAFILRGVGRMKKIKQPSNLVVSPDEFKKAETIIFKKIQKEAFPEELEKFQKMSENPEVKVELNSASPIYSLRPFIDAQGVIRMKSRKTASQLSYSSKNPAILPKVHEFVHSLWKYLHAKNHHTGIETTIADGREKAWIISARDSLYKVTKNCSTCEIKNAVARIPEIADLHEARQHFDAPPFTHVGVDCFGPISVRQGRSTVKRWGVIFTCLTFRAVHLELINEMSTDKMLMAIRRMMLSKGKIQHLYSDNGTNFIGSNNQLKRDQKEIEAEMSKAVADDLNITWHFLAAFQPWSGGAWERLVQSVKQVMKFCLDEQTPEEDVLRNAFAEAEFLINNRPLTHTPVDPDDEKPITPNSIMFGDRVPSKFTTTFDETAQFSRSRRQRAESLINHFASRWVREYLPEIGLPSKKNGKRRMAQVDDVVLMTEPNEPRSAWKLGRIIKIHPTRDGVPRIVDVKSCDGNIKLRRAVGRLVILDSTRESSK